MRGFVIVAAAATLSGCVTTIDLSDAVSRELTASEKMVISSTVSSGLKDPDAAKFKWVPLVVANSSAAYCGVVNGKNSYGGYTGFYPYIVRVSFSEKHEITSAKLMAVSSGPDEYGMDPYASSCANFGYKDFSQAK